MATRDGGGDRPVWAPTRPFELAMASRPTDFANTRPAEPYATTDTYAPAKPAEPRLLALAVGRPVPRPVPPPLGRPAAARPASAVPAFQATPPAELFQPTRPADGLQHTRPAEQVPPSRPAGPRQAARAVEFWPAPQAAQPAKAAPAAGAGGLGRANRPAETPTTPARRVVAASPTRPAVTAPSASGHWQLAGKPGEHLVLMPGQMHLGQQAASVRTLLGSCVAITLWHPLRRIGGMCHFLLPQRQRRPGDAPDGRYGDEAVEAMVKTLQTLRAEPREFVAHLYGGADTMSGCSAVSFNIGERNIEQGWSLIDRYGFTLDGVDVGEDIPRVVSLALTTGEVSMRRGSGKAPDHLRDDAG